MINAVRTDQNKIPRSGERCANQYHELPEANSPGGETECQYLSGRQYSTLWQVQCTFYPRAVCNNFLNN
jgi:hypothetical protein